MWGSLRLTPIILRLTHASLRMCVVMGMHESVNIKDECKINNNIMEKLSSVSIIHVDLMIFLKHKICETQEAKITIMFNIILYYCIKL